MNVENLKIDGVRQIERMNDMILDVKQAIEERINVGNFDESIRLDPTNPDSYLSRGIYYKHRRKSSLAREDFRRAVELGADANYVYSLLRDLR